MSISELGTTSHVIGSAHRRHADGHESFARFKVGQQLDVYVQQQLAANRYVVRFAGAQHVVETAMALTAGATFAVTVAAVGDKLELKSVSPQTPESQGQANVAAAQTVTRERDDPVSELLDTTADAFAITLSDADYAIAAAAIRDAAQPREMAHSALFLSKLDMPVEPEALSAVYAALIWQNQSTQHAGETAQARFAPAAEALAPLAKHLEEAFTANTGAAASQGLAAGAGAISASSTSSQGEDRERSLAREVLNAQTEDSVAYAYGSLPVLIADQLVELDVVLFRDRQSTAAENPLRRLVMTLKTENLGRVEIAAQALGSRLTIAIKTETTDASAAISRQADEVRELVAQLGWHIESIDFDVDPLRTRAAREIVGHVLKSGTLDRLV